MKAKELFNLTIIYTDSNGISLVSDAEWRFFVAASALVSDVVCGGDKTAIAKAYESWRIDNQIDL